MQEKKVFSYNEQGEKLAGIETLPSNANGKLAAVLLVHGFGVDKHEYGLFDGLAQRMVESGVIVYRFDFSGRGESQGNYAEVTLTKLKTDLQSMLEFVRDAPNVDKNRIGILAQSFGTSVVAALAPKAKAVVLMGSISHPLESMAVEGKWAKLDQNGTSTKVKETSGEVITINKEFWKDFGNYNLVESIKEIHCPILFIHGSKDNRIPLSEMEAYFNNANQPKEKIIIQGAEHSMEPKRKELCEVVAKWLEKNL